MFWIVFCICKDGDEMLVNGCLKEVVFIMLLVLGEVVKILVFIWFGFFFI